MAVEALSTEAPQDLIAGIKLALIDGINNRLRILYRTQQEAADALGIDQPEISRLRARRLDRFSLPWLLIVAEKIGCQVTVVVE